MAFKHRAHCFIFLFFLTFPAAVWASSAQTVKQGNRAYRQGNYQEAIQQYDMALKVGGQEPVARYNLGNALYKKGKAQEDNNIDGAIADMQQSLSDYEQVLKKNAKDGDARYNHEFVQKELERLKKKKEEQKKQQQQPQQQKQDQGQQQEQKQDQGQQGQDQQQQQKQQEQEQQKQQKQQEQQQGASAQDNKEMSKQQARDILEDYQRNEEPQGLLNFIPKKGSEKPVEKDW